MSAFFRCAACRTSGPGPYCERCGGRMAPEPPGRTLRLAGTGLGALLVLLLVVVLVKRAPAAPPPPSDAVTALNGGASPSATAEPLPDLSAMTPRERFDRLYDRAMRSAETGDQGQADLFMPMALQAYAQLDTIDADARYHAALLHAHSGRIDAAAALADTIAATQPAHLFAPMIRAMAARWRKDDAALAAAHRAFLSNLDRELAAKRPEYEAHKAMVDQFRARAEGKS